MDIFGLSSKVCRDIMGIPATVTETRISNTTTSHNQAVTATYSEPNSQGLPLAIFQHNSTSSRIFWNRRPLFAPRLFLRSSLASFLRCAPDSFFPGSSAPSAASVSALRLTWLVLPSAASSSGTSRGREERRKKEKRVCNKPSATKSNKLH